MKKCFLAIAITLFFVFLLFSQEVSSPKETDIDVPDNVRISLDAMLKTRTSNQVFNLGFLEDFYFALPTAPQKVYSNILFSGEVDADANILKEQIEQKHKKSLEEYNKFVEEKVKQLEEENKKIEETNKGLQESKKLPLKTWEKPPEPKLVYPPSYHNLYLRVIQDGKILQRFKSPVPFDEKRTEYFSFGLILESGKYDILININRFDNSSDGTLLIELNVPRLTLMDLVSPLGRIENSKPIFYKEMRASSVVENRFTVLKDQYQVGQEIFYPVIGKEFGFKSIDTPILTFFIKGAAKMENNQPQWNISPQIEIRQGNKGIVIFKTDPVQAPYFFQKIEFKKTGGVLSAGNYVLFINLNDNLNKGKKLTIEIPFKIIE